MTIRPSDTSPNLTRLDWADGAKLRGQDLRTLRDDGPARLGLHVLAGHETWGVTEGMEVRVSADGASAHVTVGAAFDCRGTVLLLPEQADLEAPGHTLVGRELEAVVGPPPGVEECGRFKVREGCAPGDTLLPVAATVRWAPSGSRVERADGQVWSPRRRDEVLLGRFRVGAGGAVVPSDRAGRMIAASRAWTPVYGASIPLGGLEWEVSPDRATAWVDTSAAGFRSRPAYSAAIEGWPIEVGGAAGTGGLPPMPQILQDSFSANHSHFQIGLLGARRPGDPPVWDGVPGLGRTQGARLVWTGAQPIEGCPWMVMTRLFFPAGFLIGGLILD